MLVCEYVSLYVCLYVWDRCVRKREIMGACVFELYVCVCVYVFMCICLYIYIYIYIYISV